MKPKVERGRRVVAWLGVACLGLLPMALSCSRQKTLGAAEAYERANSYAEKERATLKGHTGRVLSVAYCPDGKTLASGSNDKTIKLWDVATGK